MDAGISGARVIRNVRAYVSCRGYVGTLLRARATVNQGGIADKDCLFVLDRV